MHSGELSGAPHPAALSAKQRAVRVGVPASVDERDTDKEPFARRFVGHFPRGARDAGALISAADLRAYEGLFHLLCRLRAASAESLWRLHLLPVLGVTSRSAAMVRIERLVGAGYLRHLRLSSWRSVYHLMWRALVAFPSVRARGSDNARRVPALAHAHHAWLRSALCAELVSDGYTVGRGPRELAALRRFYVDAQSLAVSALSGVARASAEHVLAQLRADASLSPPFRARCRRCAASSPMGVVVERCAECGTRTKNEIPARIYRCRACGGVFDELPTHSDGNGVEHEGAGTSARCTGTLRETDVLSIDIAWRRLGSGASSTYDVRALFVDEPHRSIKMQLDQIPAQIVGQPRLPLIVRSTDPRSRFDAKTHTWRAKGPRHQALLRALEENLDETLFPFSLTTTVIDYRPELQLWAVYQGART